MIFGLLISQRAVPGFPLPEMININMHFYLVSFKISLPDVGELTWAAGDPEARG